ncbi:MAG TPA: prephenate dehydratase [Candidatus Polarisedimenticolia bacterium]|nr:prephenate dehydratase [Candidatus Polarisedimenticolia bacterium]
MTRGPSVAIQGERGAFSELAAISLFGKRARIVPCGDFDALFRSTERGRTRYALAPVENTIAGSIHRVHDLLLDSSLRVAGEAVVRIAHHLVALPGVRLGDLRRVYSHPVALAQCEKFFRRNPRLTRVATYDTAGSVRMLREEKAKDAAAIASGLAARLYGARILKEHLEDHRANFTRFFLLSRSGRPIGPPDKTSILFATRHVPGALFRCMGVFALREINLLKIESRPLLGRPWEYVFHLDFEGSAKEERCRNALRHLAEVCDFVRLLGSYPRARTPRV